MGQVIRVLGIDETELDIVRWRTIDSEGWHEYVGEVAALQALGSRDGTSAAVWPKRSLSAEQVMQLEGRMGAVAGAVREEALLPRVEYEGEHKIPIIPEPLGIISLQRRERRVDALSSMGACLAVVVAVTAILFWFTLRPPWVPGA